VKKIIFMALAIVLSGSMVMAAARLQKITLKDASVIIGRIVEMKGGSYSIESPTLGEIKVAEDNIVEIRALGENEDVSPSAGQAKQNLSIQDGSKKRRVSPARQKYEQSLRQQQNSGSDDLARQQEEVNTRVKSMTADGNFLNSLMDISQNENMLEVMSDPEIMEAISNNDYDFLMNNEKMKNLMESSEMREFLGDVE
jgi:hypothetical protein